MRLSSLAFPLLVADYCRTIYRPPLVNWWFDPVMLESFRIIKSGLSNKAYLHVLSLHINAHMDVKYAQTIAGLHNQIAIHHVYDEASSNAVSHESEESACRVGCEALLWFEHT